MTADPPQEPTRKNRLLGWLKLAGTVAMFAILFFVIPLNEVWASLVKVNPLVWLGVFVGYLAGHTLAAAKWRALIGEPIPYWTALKAHFAGLAASLALPGVAGGDVVRAVVMMRAKVRKADLVLASLVDRVIDSVTLLAISAIGLAMLGAQAGLHDSWVYIATVGVAIIGFASVMMLQPIASFIRTIKAGGSAGRLFALLSEALGRMAGRKTTILVCVVMSIVIQTAFAMLNAALSASIGGPDSVALWLFAWPLAKLIATLPISIGGLGVREAGLSGLMAPFSPTTAPVIAASLLWQTIVVAGGLLGAFVQVASSVAQTPKRT
ncbi:MAG: lysylphosphatidylglycerol synthase transmembrane domain-containing protein [Alphaproteobacteria bacterium]|nr:lysylphosphatidylglycerol synthase transmembrane domain-containing protein [Alphaproteobacteria bacterium]